MMEREGIALKLQTKYFGEIEYEQAETLHFPVGLFGFEEEHHFLLLPFDDSGSLFCFQSTMTPALAFVAMHPFSLQSDYAPVLQAEELKALDVERSEDLHYFTLCVLKRPVSESTVNMKCPICINETTRQARQVILDTDVYEMRHSLAEFCRKGGEETASC